MWQTHIEKAIDKVISMKFFVLLLCTWLFYIDKLNQDGWVTVTLSVTGMRVVNEVASMYKDIRTAAKPAKAAK